MAVYHQRLPAESLPASSIASPYRAREGGLALAETIDVDRRTEITDFHAKAISAASHTEPSAVSPSPRRT